MSVDAQGTYSSAEESQALTEDVLQESGQLREKVSIDAPLSLPPNLLSRPCRLREALAELLGRFPRTCSPGCDSLGIWALRYLL